MYPYQLGASNSGLFQAWMILANRCNWDIKLIGYCSIRKHNVYFSFVTNLTSYSGYFN